MLATISYNDMAQSGRETPRRTQTFVTKPLTSNEILPAPSSFCGRKIDVFESKMIPRDKTIYHIKIGSTKTSVLPSTNYNPFTSKNGSGFLRKIWGWLLEISFYYSCKNQSNKLGTLMATKKALFFGLSCLSTASSKISMTLDFRSIKFWSCIVLSLLW